MISRVVIAREWLYLVGGVILGVLLVPTLLFLLASLFSDRPIPAAEFYGDVYRAAIRGDRDTIAFWAWMLAPYAVFQLGRSVRWAWNVIRNSNM